MKRPYLLVKGEIDRGQAGSWLKGKQRFELEQGRLSG
jgi:hypothetical protein